MGHGKNHVIDRRRFVQASSVAAAALALGATGCASSHPVAETGGTTTQFVAGTYQATALGKKSDITVEVVFSDTAIDSVRVVDHGETERIAAPAFEKIPEIIVASQSLAVDAVTGATLSSLALLSAVEDCARQADGDVSALKRAEVPKEQPTDEEIECDLAVIGAGISGMASALAAAQQGAKVVVFEKSSSMGGNALVSGGFIEYANAPEELRVEVNDGYLKIFQEVLQFNRDAGLDASLVDEVQQQWDDYYANGNTKLFSSPEFLALQLCMLEGNTYDFQHTYATDVEGGTAWLDTMQFPWMPLVAIPGYSWAHFSGSSEDVNGEGYFNVFEREMEGLDLRILFATPATELITESGRVTGAAQTAARTPCALKTVSLSPLEAMPTTRIC